jgi:D-glycero-D-manno-heptose 1,7-bisphosphate phosphatase
MHPALFLDRDGVIIENQPNYVRRWEEVHFFPQALTALARIAHTPYKIILVTNQSAVGRGILPYETVLALNNRIIEQVQHAHGRIDATYICPDAPWENSGCRKPLPGMLHQAAQDHNLNLHQSIMLGDALSDVQAGRAAGVHTTALLLTGRGTDQATQPEAATLAPLLTFPDLQTALLTLIPT